jgi:putative N6-adenine-specific DNA methylase
VARTAFAVVAPGLEPLAAAELRAIGVADATTEPGGVAFSHTDETLASSLIQLRTVSRVLVRLAEFHTTGFPQLEKRARAIAWSDWIRAGARVRFRVTCKKSRLYHSDAVAERLASAVVAAVAGVTIDDAPRDAAGDDDTGSDDAQLFVVRMFRDVCTISADASGVHMHKRGYRQAVAKAPLRETFAAAMLLGAPWDPTTALCDPLCGSGTIVIEAALMARRIAPGLQRTFAAEHWPAADSDVWKRMRERAQADVRPSTPSLLAGSDRDAGAIDAARANAQRAGVANDVTFSVGSVSSARTDAEYGLLVTNPPFGVRVGDTAALRDLYARFGRIARERFTGWQCAVLSADRSRGHALERQLALPLRPVWQSRNGGIPVRLLAGTIPR